MRGVGRTCDYPGCSEPVARRCYFCENSCCERHITVANGSIRYACAGKEQEKQEERERAAREAQERARASGCLLALAAAMLLLRLPFTHSRPRFRRRQ